MERFLYFIDGLRLKPGVPLFPPLSEVEYQQRVEVIALHKSFPVASVCRADLQGLFADEEIARLSDSQMERIADKMGDSFSESGYWDSLELIARSVIERQAEENIIEGD